MQPSFPTPSSELTLMSYSNGVIYRINASYESLCTWTPLVVLMRGAKNEPYPPQVG
jgi:hypothetical protein